MDKLINNYVTYNTNIIKKNKLGILETNKASIINLLIECNRNIHLFDNEEKKTNIKLIEYGIN